MNNLKIFLLAFLIMLLTLLGQAQSITIPLRYDRYYTYEEIVQAIKALNVAYPELTKLVLVGYSDENREIWALEINNPKTGKTLDKPGVYVDGNIHGNELQAAEVTLYFGEYLLKNYNKLDEITELVDKNAYYLIPVVNVDGRYHFMREGNTMNSSRSLRRPQDDDRDGLLDEDFPDDLDGDGNICTMRIKDSHGLHKSDPVDPRIMVRVKEGEPGEWTLLGPEGLDNDNDGKVNEDAEGYLDPNRNWGFDWNPPYVQRGAGEYPFSGTGIRAIANYMMERQNIIVFFTFHNSGGLFLRGPSNKAQGPLNPQDIAVYDVMGQNAEKIVPGYDYLILWKDLYSTYGDTGGFAFNVLGAYSFVGELFQSDTETYSGKPSAKEETHSETSQIERLRERLKFNDHVAHGTLFKDWTPYKHPVYGDIEIGGWVKYSSRLPHPFMMPDLVHRNASAVIFSAGQTPQIEMEVISNEKVGKNLYEIDVQLVNKKAIPSLSYHAVQKNILLKDILKLNGEGAKVIAGGKILNRYLDQVMYKEFKPEIHFLQVPGYGKIEYRFLVSGKGNLDVQYESVKANNISQTIQLK